MSETCNSDCSSCGEDCASRQAPEDLMEKPNSLSSVKKVIAIVSGKGGVGKSLVTELMAVGMQRRGFHCGVLDADITGPSIPRAFGVTAKAYGSDMGIYPVSTQTGIDLMSVNLLLENDADPVIWRGPVLGGVVKQFWTDVIWDDIDFLFVDMPPGTGDVPLTVFQSLPVDGIIVVTSPQDVVSMIVEKAVRMAEMMNIPILGLVENYSYITCPDCGKKLAVFGESHINEIADAHALPVLAKLPINPELAAAVDAGQIEMFNADLLPEACSMLEAILKISESGKKE